MKLTLRIYKVEYKWEAGGMGNGSCFPGHKVSLWEGEQVPNMDGGDGCKTV